MIANFLMRGRVWLMATGVALLAGLVRFGTLSHPKLLVFDEVFYVRGAFSLLTQGFEGNWEGDNQDFAHGDYSGLTREGDYVVHPLLGKLLIALGMDWFGATPFGWRFMGALLGTATVVIVALTTRQLLGSTLWGGVAGVLLALEGSHIVLSRTALLDIFLTFFVVAGFALLVADRAYARRRLFDRADAVRTSAKLSPGALVPGLGPGTWWRPWRLAAIVVLSLSVSVKWSGLVFMAAFLVLSVVWDWLDHYQAGVERWFAGALVRALPPFVITLVMLPAIYIASWWPWFASAESYGRTWAQDNPGAGLTWLPESLRSLAHYHGQMLTFHSGLDDQHNYMSNPWGWLVQWRPTAFFFEDAPEAACGAERCVSAITSLGHPFVWWAGVAALVYALWRVVRRADMVAVAGVVGVLAGWVPWLVMSHRTIFTFYTVAIAPFVVITVVWALKRLAEPEPRGPHLVAGRFSPAGIAMVTLYVVAVMVLAGLFLPIWTGQPIPYDYWQLHMWLPSWV